MTQLKMGTTVKGVTLKSNTEDKIIVQCSHWNAVPWAILVTQGDPSTLYFVSGADDIEFILENSDAPPSVSTWSEATGEKLKAKAKKK